MDAILDKFYTHFSKDHIAGFAKELSLLADDGDGFAMNIFEQAGFEIGRHILAIQPAIKLSTIDKKNLNVICTGSVFRSWKYLKPGFEKIIMLAKPAKGNALNWVAKRLSKHISPGGDVDSVTPQYPAMNEHVKRITLLSLKIPAAVGAAVWAASKMNVQIDEPNRSKISEKIDEIMISQ